MPLVGSSRSTPSSSACPCDRAGEQARRLGARLRLRGRRELARGDLRGKDAEPHLPPVHVERPVPGAVRAGEIDGGGGEVVAVGGGLEAEHVGRQHVPEQAADAGRDHRRFGRRERHVEVEAGRVAQAALPQAPRQAHQVVVMHPDPVVRLEQRRQVLGEAPVHPAIGLQILAAEGHQVREAVQHRPEHAVGVARVVAAVLGLRQVEGGVADARRVAKRPGGPRAPSRRRSSRTRGRPAAPSARAAPPPSRPPGRHCPQGSGTRLETMTIRLIPPPAAPPAGRRGPRRRAAGRPVRREPRR